jgi:uncharacterized membrane protein YedE/YeeE
MSASTKDPSKSRQLVASFVSGLLFAVGLALAGMTQPQKVIGFLDVFGRWDPSLMFVMAGGIAVNGVVWALVKGRATPMFSAKWLVPTRRDLDAKLIVGAALFGLGWGLGGFCPGPGIVSLASGARAPIVFVLAMLVGMRAVALWEWREAARQAGATVTA